jgi:hypothetical protein
MERMMRAMSLLTSRIGVIGEGAKKMERLEL